MPEVSQQFARHCDLALFT